jgi:hypothetical protein
LSDAPGALATAAAVKPKKTKTFAYGFANVEISRTSITAD